MEDLQAASEKYADIPKDCFSAKVDFNVRYFPDNEIVPRGDLSLTSASGARTKWIKASRFKPFVNACKAFGLNSGGSVLAEALHVVVMPYMPLEDAFELHAFIQDADVLSDSFEDAVQLLEANDHNQQIVVPMDLEEEDVEVTDEKVGHLAADDDNIIIVGFTVTNYSVLWSKADTYRKLSFLTNPIHMFVDRIQSCDQVMANRVIAYIMEGLEAGLEEARRHLIFAMYYERTPDAHGALLQLYPEIHNHVYLDCQHCNPQSDDVSEDSSGTTERLNEALTNLGYANYNPHLSVEQAKYNLMTAEGLIEFNHHYVNASLAFTNARQAFRAALLPIKDNLFLAKRQLTLMGADSVEENVDEDGGQDVNEDDS